MRKLDNLQKKLDMWQRTATMYGSINVTLTPSDVVQLHQDVAVLYARIAELEEFKMIVEGCGFEVITEPPVLNHPERKILKGHGTIYVPPEVTE